MWKVKPYILELGCCDGLQSTSPTVRDSYWNPCLNPKDPVGVPDRRTRGLLPKQQLWPDQKVVEIWQQARIPNQRIEFGVCFLIELLREYENLKKDWKRNNDQIRRTNKYSTVNFSAFVINLSHGLSTMKFEGRRLMKRNDVIFFIMAEVLLLNKKTEKEEQFCIR